MTFPSMKFLGANSLDGGSTPWSDLVFAVWQGEGSPDKWVVHLSECPTTTSPPTRGSATALSSAMSDVDARDEVAEVPHAS